MAESDHRGGQAEAAYGLRRRPEHRALVVGDRRVGFSECVGHPLDRQAVFGMVEQFSNHPALLGCQSIANDDLERLHSPSEFVEVRGVHAQSITLIAATGLRRGEALALHWRDVDLEAGTLRVRGTLARVDGHLVVSEPKTARSRRVLRLSPAVIALLKVHRKTQATERIKAANIWHESDFVFTTEDGQPVDPRNFLRALTTAATKAGLTDVGVHTLRHSAASALLEAGIGLKTVSEMLGHSSVAITDDVYQHVSDGAAQAAADALSSAIGL